MIELTKNAIRVLEKRYLLKDENGNVVETPEQLFKRVAKTVAKAEKNMGGQDKIVQKWEDKFYEVMTNLEFLPNSPTLANAGKEIGQLSACFTLPIPDDMDGIFRAVHDTAMIHKSGGGTGFSFSRLRPVGDRVSSTSGTASGPISFMRVFDVAT